MRARSRLAHTRQSKGEEVFRKTAENRMFRKKTAGSAEGSGAILFLSSLLEFSLNTTLVAYATQKNKKLFFPKSCLFTFQLLCFRLIEPTLQRFAVFSVVVISCVLLKPV